jgi:hypothetical protein
VKRTAAVEWAVAALVAGLLCASAQAASVVLEDACYVRSDGVASAAARPAGSDAPQNHLGLRRRATQLVDVELALSGEALAQCHITGTARVRGPAGAEYLVLPVRPDAGVASARDAPLCLVRIEATGSAIELSTTEPACRAQGVCGGRVALHGQRFGLALRTSPEAPAPCFAR